MITLREMQADDRAGAAGLLSAGIGGARAVWEARFTTWWDRNPAMTDRIPWGWVLEDDAGGVVGFLGNVPAPFKIGDTTVLSCSMTSWLVLPPYRSYGPMMASRFFGQEVPDLWLNTTANEPVAKVCQAFGARPIPLPSLGQTLYWVTSARQFVQGALRRFGLAPPLAAVGGAAGAVPFEIAERSRSLKRADSAGTGQTVSVKECGAEFDRLWEAVSPSLPACGVRSAEQVAWRYVSPGRPGCGLLGYVEERGGLGGYLAYRVEDIERMQMRRMAVLDLFAPPNDPASAQALLSAAISLAGMQGAAVVETTGGTRDCQQAVLALKPRSRARPASACLFKVKDPALAESLARPDAWHVTLYDGDASLL